MLFITKKQLRISKRVESMSAGQARCVCVCVGVALGLTDTGLCLLGRPLAWQWSGASVPPPPKLWEPQTGTDSGSSTSLGGNTTAMQSCGAWKPPLEEAVCVARISLPN